MTIPPSPFPTWGLLEQRSILQVLADRLDADPDGPYLDLPGRAYSAAEMTDEALRAAAGMATLGVGSGDRVATLLDNGPPAVSVWLGALALGALPVPLNPANQGEFLRHPLVDSGAKLVVAADRYLDRLTAVLEDGPELAPVVVVSTGDPAAGIEPAPSVRRLEWDDLLTAAPDRLDPSRVRPEDLATLIYTAGTTGPSKACMLSHNYVVNACSRTAPAWGRTADDVLWTPLPLFHFAPYQHVVLGALVVGGRGAIGDRFSVSGFWGEITRTGATMAALLGTMTAMLARQEGTAHEDGHRLRLVIAVPSPPDVEAVWWERFGVETFSGGYALTEGGPLSLLAPGQPNKPGAAGVAGTPDFDTRVFDDQDRDVGPDVVGEIVTRPRHPHVMFEGYWGRPEATLATLGGLWFHTGDLGRIDADGYLFFVDRKKDYLRRRGENISSFEVEAAVRSHGDVVEVAAHAVASDVGEDEVKVTVVLRRGATVTEESLCAWCVTRMPYFAVPRYVEFRDELPRNPVGRVLKFVLRDQGVTPTTWDREASELRIKRY